jgi:hypothetical protein
MIIVGPAVGFGALLVLGVVFCAGYVVAYVVLEAIAKWSARKLSKWRYYLTEDNVYKYAIIGGIIPVAGVVILFFNMPRGSSSSVWSALTVLGILFGISTFLISAAMSKDEPRVKYKLPPSTGVPPARGNVYRPTASIKPPPSAPEDFYRNLLAKARYDKDLADRLIEYERKRTPRASFDDLCKSAIERWEHDNR